MNHYIGLDISDATTNICIVDKNGAIVNELKVPTTFQLIISALDSLRIPISKIGMETGPVSNWLCHKLRERWPATVCFDAFKMSKLIALKVNKTDKNDAQIIAEVVRLDCLSEVLNLKVHTKSVKSQEIITLVRARESLVHKNVQIYNEVRAMAKTHGFTIPKSTTELFTKVVKDGLKQLPLLVASIISDMISLYDPILKLINKLTGQIAVIAKHDPDIQRLKTVENIGDITAVYFKALIDDPQRFLNSRSVGAYLGLTPSQYSSGGSERQGAISKRGDELGRKLLVSAAQRILQRNAPSTDLKAKGQKLEKKRGKGRSAVALARRLAGILYQLLKTKTSYKEKKTAPSPKVMKALTTDNIRTLLELSKKTGEIKYSSSGHLEKMAKNTAFVKKTDVAI